MEDAETSCSGGEEVEELPIIVVVVSSTLPSSSAFGTGGRKHSHNHQRHKVNARSRIRRCRDVRWIVLRIVLPEFQPHGRERDALPLHVPEGHGEGEEALEQSDNEVRMEHEPRIDQAIFLGVAGWAC